MVTKYGPPYFYVGLAEDELAKENSLEAAVEQLQDAGVLGTDVNLTEYEIRILAEQHAPLNEQEREFEKRKGQPITLTERRILRIRNEED